MDRRLHGWRRQAPHTAIRPKARAEAFASAAAVEIIKGIHFADGATITVAEAATQWIARGEALGRERTTIVQRRQHVEGHILPFIGAMKLNKLSVPAISTFQDQLRSAGRSSDMIKRVTISLGGIISEAQRRGLAAQNPIRSMSRTDATEKRHKKRLEVGIDLPTPDEIRRLIAALPTSPRSLKPRTFLLVVIFSGLRARPGGSGGKMWTYRTLPLLFASGLIATRRLVRRNRPLAVAAFPFLQSW